MTTATPSRPDFREQQAGDAPKWWREFSDLERSVVLVTIVVMIIAGALYGLGTSFTLISDFAPNVMTEILFFAFTIVVIDRLNRQRSKNERKEELILQMGSSDNGFATEAVRLLRHYGWLEDGSLIRAKLSGADLTGADLREAVLERALLESTVVSGAKLHHANLLGANLMDAHLEEAVLLVANLQDTYMEKTNLARASLIFANLKDANLLEANLQGADLKSANLKGAILKESQLSEYLVTGYPPMFADTKFDIETILPDGTKWSPDVDMGKFTDPDHPDFWQPDWVKGE